MLAHMKIIVLVKEAVNLAPFGLSSWSISDCGFDYKFKMVKTKNFLLKLVLKK